MNEAIIHLIRTTELCPYNERVNGPNDKLGATNECMLYASGLP